MTRKPPASSRRSRLRTDNPVAIRGWVTELPSDGVYKELLLRQKEFDRALQPHREAIVRANRLITERLAWLTRGSAPAVSKEREERAARTFLAHVVASYWEQYPFRPGWRLPRITMLVSPWQLPPDMIHIFDLDPRRIHRAVSRSARLRRLTKVSDQDADDLLIASAGDEIRIHGPLAPFWPTVQAVQYVLLSRVREVDTAQAADAAAAEVSWLFDQFLDDPSRRIALRADRLAKLRADYRPIYDQALRLAEALEKRVAPDIESLTKELFSPRGLRDRVLRQWKQRPPQVDTIARLAYARRHHVADRTLRRQLTLADKAEVITESWGEFLKYFATLPEASTRQVLGFFLSLDPVPATGPGASSGHAAATQNTPPGA